MMTRDKLREYIRPDNWCGAVIPETVDDAVIPGGLVCTRDVAHKGAHISLVCDAIEADYLDMPRDEAIRRLRHMVELHNKTYLALAESRREIEKLNETIARMAMVKGKKR